MAYEVSIFKSFFLGEHLLFVYLLYDGSVVTISANEYIVGFDEAPTYFVFKIKSVGTLTQQDLTGFRKIKVSQTDNKPVVDYKQT